MVCSTGKMMSRFVTHPHRQLRLPHSVSRVQFLMRVNDISHRFLFGVFVLADCGGNGSTSLFV